MHKYKRSLRLCHLYPDYMNLYGDFGNVLALHRRAELHGIHLEYLPLSIGDALDPKAYDLFFMGGGQDREQAVLLSDWHQKGAALALAIELGVPMLGICGGYQLMGQRFLTKEGTEIQGLGIIEVETIGKDQRLIGDTMYQADFLRERGEDADLLFGFENHSGQSFLRGNAKALGKVLFGYGNNSEDQTEGCVYKHFVGTYAHGSFLPRNPAMSDWLLEKALCLRYQEEIKLPYILTDAEAKAREAAKRLIEKRRSEKD